jgi:hypothetical protein
MTSHRFAGSNVIPFPVPATPPQPRVLLTLDNRRVISAKYYSFVNDCGVSVGCEHESIEYYTVEGNPTIADYYEIHVADDATYEEKKQALLAATGWDFEDEFGWLEVDESGEVIPGTDTDESITNFLRRPLLDFGCEPYIDMYYDFGSRTSTQYTPGFIIWDALNEEEREVLKLRNSDLGGPASSVPCISTLASIDELNEALERHGLPFVFVDDDGSEER